ncbi:MAG: HEAT repeat domain-containing protein, partial [Halobacteria archaeon]|nr:HEAT repeat domain-containing protein [Halobacteria archaeon]
ADAPDPSLNPELGRVIGGDVESFEDIDVGREVELGEASPAEFSASDTEPIVDEPIGVILHQLIEGNVVERRRAALALSEREPTESVVESLEDATWDEDAEVRQFAVESLGKLGNDGNENDSEIFDTVHSAMEDSDPWVRSEAVVALHRVSDDTKPLHEALDDEHHAVRRNAMIALYKQNDGRLDDGNEITRILVEHLEDPSERVREWAAHILGEADSEKAVDALRETANNDESELVRETAARALDVSGNGYTGVEPSERNDVLNRKPDL